jgi:hypothetical protein
MKKGVIEYDSDSDSDSDFEEFYRNAIKKSVREIKQYRNIIDVEINNIRSFRERESLFQDNIQYVEIPCKKRNVACTIM